MPIVIGVRYGITTYTLVYIQSLFQNSFLLFLQIQFQLELPVTCIILYTV
jgi:hypothetical protein